MILINSKFDSSTNNDQLINQENINNLIKWWTKLERQAEGGNQEPLLFFKYNRSPVFVCSREKPNLTEFMYISKLVCWVMLEE